MLGNNANYECTECGFDTLPIVTVNYQTWECCPECGSELTEFNGDEVSHTEEEEEIDDSKEMTIIPINGETAGKVKTDEDSDSDTDDVKDSTNSVDQSSTDEEDEVKEFVEDEMERLRSRYGSEEGED